MRLVEEPDEEEEPDGEDEPEEREVEPELLRGEETDVLRAGVAVERAGAAVAERELLL